MRVVRGMSALALIVVACSRGGVTADGSGPAEIFDATDVLQSDGPLRGVALTGYEDRSNPAFRPALTFTSDDVEATAVVALGEVPAGATLDVTWYRVAGDGERDFLFSHEIAVESGGAAFSQGVAAGGLAPGMYETVATMGDRLVHTPWVVREAKAAASSNDGLAGAASQAASTEGESTSTPAAGKSGYQPFWDLPFEPGPPPDTCTVDSIDAGMRPMTDIKASAWFLGPCSTGTLTAAVTGSPVALASSDNLEVPVGKLYGQTDVCGMSGGSDLPGTDVHFEVTGSASATEVFVLPDFGESLTAGLEGTPAAGTKVQAGDRIDVLALALAMVMPPALGVKTLYVDDGNDLIESVGNQSGSDEPQPCDPRRIIAALRTQYRVPNDPPPIIELCATGVGFDGTKAKDCIRYYTGDVWKGTLSGSHTGHGSGDSCTFPVSGTFEVTVDGTGIVTGEGEFDVHGCGDTRGGTWPITGLLDEDSVELNISDYLVTKAEVPISSPGHAAGDVEYHDRYNDAVARFEMDCVTCEEPGPPTQSIRGGHTSGRVGCSRKAHVGRIRTLRTIGRMGLSSMSEAFKTRTASATTGRFGQEHPRAT